MIRISIPVAALSLLLQIACGGSDGGSLDKLSDADKARFKGTLESANRSLRAPASAAMGRPQEPADLLAFEASEQDYAEMLDELSTAIENGACDAKAKLPEFDFDLGGEDKPNVSEAAEKAEFAIEFSGATCPIELKASIKPSVKETDDSAEVSADIKWDYTVKSEAYKAQNDIFGSKGSGRFGLSFKGNENSLSLKLDLGFEATLSSTQHGDIPLSASFDFKASGNQNKFDGSGQFLLAVDYGDKKAGLRMVVKGDSEPEYFIGTDKVDEKEFNEFLETTLSGLTEGGGFGGGGDPFGGEDEEDFDF